MKKYKAEIAGAVAGGAVFMAGVGLARLITSPFRGPRNELEASKARMAQPTVIIEHHYQEVHIRQQTTKAPKEHTVIDMGPVDEYDQFAPDTLVHAQRQWDQNQQRRQEEQNFNNFCHNLHKQQVQAEGGYPWQQQARRDAEKQRRKEQGFLKSLFKK